MDAVSNFESIAAELVRVAPTQKAADSALRTADKIRARGPEWIAAHVNELHIYSSNEEQYFPVADNRIFFFHFDKFLFIYARLLLNLLLYRTM